MARHASITTDVFSSDSLYPWQNDRGILEPPLARVGASNTHRVNYPLKTVIRGINLQLIVDGVG